MYVFLYPEACTSDSPDFGSVNDDNWPVEKYSCFNGYELIGDKERTCQSDGSWSPVAIPRCEGEYFLGFFIFISL